MDADDYSNHQRLEKQLRYIQNNEYDIIFTSINIINNTNFTQEIFSKDSTFKNSFFK